MAGPGRLVFAFLALLLAAAPLQAADPDERERLFEELLNAPTETAARTAEDAIWRMWMAQGPTAQVRRDVAEAMRARESYDFDQALRILDGVVAAAPDYAEGWNQRAFVHFLKENLDDALSDIDRALELEPKHFAALAGKALVLMRQGRMELSQQALREAIAIDPWLRERHMLIPMPGEVLPRPGGTPI
ncbi:tetratricopeptide repeat protein [Aquibium sp. LZ166]|uniref:Tetratricopeptide repeat protein n=1 Tax=Aquibium pacificus TaxID=3153579 RepID=A0ABV3SHN6_9HYPH